MPKGPILNPFVTCFPDPTDPEVWLIQSPVPGSGMQRLAVKSSEHPRLHSLLEQIGDDDQSLANIYDDLDADELELFREFGILIDPENAPEKVLFSCKLDDLDVNGWDAGDTLCVNPTMEFEPFDLTKFRSWAAEKNLSPYTPSVWIRDKHTGLRSGYWLTNEQAAAISRLSIGEPPPADLDLDLCSKLTAAGIVGDREKFKNIDLEREKEIADARQFFSQHRYSIIRNIIPNRQIEAFRRFYREFVGQGFMTLGDDFVPDRFVAPLEPLAKTVHQDLTELMTTIAGEPVKPSYCYAACYLEGADLKPHVDREQCKYSFSMQIDYQPASNEGISPWPLYLSLNETGPDLAVHLSDGDCLAYKGCEIVHYRNALPKGHRSTSLFFHYVPVDFDGKLT